ncbi:MFS transporter [Actinomycetospora sp. NBRC 106375]|uniref:MFS transporter n=1 Tax=Actinomycetospora sp. NBRC 106375 TaxID=3032207 RepID=UPI0024A1990B|nr:MFS transporter [Actinomycetospora sp. NBRC 106375]GLZ43915.1 MFS transporter [Actinomycetospora sp. NBRC 106375]
MTEAPSRPTVARLQVAGLYAGGFLGPFGGGITASMLPELGADLGMSPSAASSSLTAYLLPFALLMLVSGTLGQRWGARRTVRTAYVAYVVFSLLGAVATTGWLFLGARALQGAANAFTTPLLLASLAAASPPERLGRSLGVMGSLQAAGMTFAPLVGGIAAALDWRGAFVGVAVVAAVLAAVGLPAAPARDTERSGAGPEGTDAGDRPRLRDAWRPSVLRLGLVAGLAWGALGGLAFLVALRVEDAFALGAGLRGALLTGFGIVGLLTARLIGGGVDRVGPGVAVRVGAVAAAVLVTAVGVLPSPLAVAVVWALAGATAQLVLVGVNTLVLRGGTAGGVSVVQALRFLGAAASPAVFLAPYHLSPVAGFGLAGVVLLGAAMLVPRR